MNEIDAQLLAHGTWDTLAPALRALSRATCALPFAQLLPGERAILGGSLFVEGGHFVELVAAALRDHPALFPDLDVDPAALLEAERAAFLWASLRNQLEALAQRAADTCVKLRALATQQALSVVEHVRQVAALPASRRMAGRLHAERIDALTPALLVLHTYRRSLVTIRKKKQRARARQAAASPLSLRAPSTDEGAPPAWARPAPPAEGGSAPWTRPAPAGEGAPPRPGPAPAGEGAPPRPGPSPKKRRAMAEARLRERARLRAALGERARIVSSARHALDPPSS